MTAIPLIVRFVEGDTTPRKFRLMRDGQPENLVGMPVGGVVAIVYNRLGIAVDMTSNLTILDPALGDVQIEPDPADFAAKYTPHRLRFKVTDPLSNVAYYPDDGAVQILVQAP